METLEQWIARGGNGLSQWAIFFACRDTGARNEGELRAMTLDHVMTSRLASCEIARFAAGNGMTVRR